MANGVKLKKYIIEILFLIAFFYVFAMVELWFWSGDFQLNIFKSKALKEFVIVTIVALPFVIFFRKRRSKKNLYK